MSYKPIFLFLFLLLSMISCGKKYGITIGNHCESDTIMVEYVSLDNGDTHNIQLKPISSYHIYTSHPQYGNNDFTADYRVHINYIINMSGDSINFDPNVEQVWGRGSNPEAYIYYLQINEFSF